MKKQTINIFFLMLCSLGLQPTTSAQVAINSTQADPDVSAFLDVASTTKGFLMPRMTANDRLAIGSPATGLFLFQTDYEAGFQYNSGTPALPTWTALGTAEVDTTFCNHRIPMDSVGNGLPPFTITEPGSYYFTKDIIGNANNGDGITIAANYVTIDLNGYSLKPDPNIASDDGIFISGLRDNIVIKNGHIEGWDDDGVNGDNAEQSRFENLKLKDNGGSGLIINFDGLIINCQAISNGVDGLKGNDGTIIVDCTAAQNGENGIEMENGGIVIRCTSFGNKTDGFDIRAGSRIEDCTAYDNEVFGFDIASGGQVISCNAYNNGGNGFDIASSCLLLNSKASSNGFCISDTNCSRQPSSTDASALGSYGNGVRTFANSQIINCTFTNNARVGIRISSTDTYVSGNLCVNNRNVGIYATSSNSLFLNNICRNNGTAPSPDFLDTDGTTVVSGNYVIPSDNAFGPIVNVSGVGDISGTTNAKHPFANFEY